MNRLKGKMCMVNNIPWEKAWLDFKFQVGELQKTAIKFSERLVKKGKTKSRPNQRPTSPGGKRLDPGQ